LTTTGLLLDKDLVVPCIAWVGNASPLKARKRIMNPTSRYLRSEWTGVECITRRGDVG